MDIENQTYTYVQYNAFTEGDEAYRGWIDDADGVTVAYVDGATGELVSRSRLQSVPAADVGTE